MSLASGIAAGLSALAGAVKALNGRVTAVEQRTPVVVLTQAAYDALTPKDAGTVYVISP